VADATGRSRRWLTQSIRTHSIPATLEYARPDGGEGTAMQSPRTPGVRRRLPRCPPQTAQPHAQGKVACPPSGGYAASRGSSLSWLPGRPGTGGHAPLPQSWTAGTPSPTPLALACRQVPAARAATCQERFLLPPCRTNPCDLRTPGGADCRTNPMSSWRPPSPPRPLTGLLESAVIRACPLDVWRVPSNLSSPSPSICANPRHLRTSPWSVAGSCETNPIRQNTSSTRRIRLASEAGSAGCPLPGLPAAMCANVCHLRTPPWSLARLLQNEPNWRRARRHPERGHRTDRGTSAVRPREALRPQQSLRGTNPIRRKPLARNAIRNPGRRSSAVCRRPLRATGRRQSRSAERTE
jgi:hypothetical protein